MLTVYVDRASGLSGSSKKGFTRNITARVCVGDLHKGTEHSQVGWMVGALLLLLCVLGAGDMCRGQGAVHEWQDVRAVLNQRRLALPHIIHTLCRCRSVTARTRSSMRRSR